MMDFSNFPHPDKHCPHPMIHWPADVELPVSIELDDYKVGVAAITDDLAEDVGEQILDYPSCKIVMPNGAELVVVQYGDSAFDAEEIQKGDWTLYLRDGERRLQKIVDVAVETIYQALSAEFDEAELDEAEVEL